MYTVQICSCFHSYGIKIVEHWIRSFDMGKGFVLFHPCQFFLTKIVTITLEHDPPYSADLTFTKKK